MAFVSFVTDGLLYLFQDGQKICKKGFGHIIEFDDTMTQEDFVNFFEIIIQTFNLRTSGVYHPFYLGLTDRVKEDEWKWESSGKIFNMTQSPRKWGKNEPNGHKNEDCAVLQVYAIEIHDWNCDRKFTIICQRKISA